MTFITELAAKRRQLLDGLRANEGDINLRIFEDFYPDEAHFIYELLQNAEDAGATEASFELTRGGCTFVHNGSRQFDEKDIRAITGIFNSSKKDNPDRIGKFGVGFKSVFVYTETPVVYSRDYSFRITQLVLPESIAPRQDLGGCTRFEFPFNNVKKPPTQAFAEVLGGLEALSERTLLYLNSLRYISWKCDGREGAVLRMEHSSCHVEVLKEAENRKLMSSHWLRLTAPVVGLERQLVAVAYELEFLGNATEFDPAKSLATQMKIVPAVRGQVSVFFPADKETSGLRFHLHAPFVPELSRASIKNCAENEPLFDQLAVVAARSLHDVKALGLLTGEFLAVLPNEDDAVEQRYRTIRSAIIAEMREQPLTPTHRKGHAPARTLLQGRATLKELLTDNDLEFLLAREDHPTWAIAATQRNSNQDRFLASLAIKEWDADSLAELLGERACESEYAWRGRLDPAVMGWLSGKTDEWHQQLYAVLYRLLEDDDDFSVLEDAKIIRLEDGSYRRANETYFPSESVAPSDPFPRVSTAILKGGSRKVQQVDARRLLEKLGVRDVGEREEIALVLENRYAKDSTRPSDDVYAADLKRFMAFFEKNPAERQQFKDAVLFCVDTDDAAWYAANSIYLDTPFKDTGLAAFHEALPADRRKKYPLSNWYVASGIELERLATFAEAVGCSIAFSEFFVPTYCFNNPKWDYLRDVAGERNSSPIDRDCSTSKFAYELLQSENVDFSRLVWKTMCSIGTRFLTATFQRNTTNGCRQAPSQLTYLLSQAAWVPQQDGQFVAPRYARRDGLLTGFTFDAGYKWLEMVHFGEEERKTSAEQAERARKRAELGFESDDEFERAREFAQLPLEEQERILAEHRARTAAVTEEFPVRPVRNRDLRHQRVREAAGDTPEKESQHRQRSVAVGYDAIKTEARLYLQEQYTNANGVMFCQVCKGALPFRLPSGAFYFDAAEAVDSLSKRFREVYLSLCPNHAAMFRYANDSREDMQELIEVAVGLEIDVTLGGEPSSILFTEMHLADIKACLSALDDNENEPSAAV